MPTRKASRNFPGQPSTKSLKLSNLVKRQRMPKRRVLNTAPHADCNILYRTGAKTASICFGRMADEGTDGARRCWVHAPAPRLCFSILTGPKLQAANVRRLLIACAFGRTGRPNVHTGRHSSFSILRPNSLPSRASVIMHPLHPL